MATDAYIIIDNDRQHLLLTTPECLRFGKLCRYDMCAAWVVYGQVAQSILRMNPFGEARLLDVLLRVEGVTLKELPSKVPVGTFVRGAVGTYGGHRLMTVRSDEQDGMLITFAN